MKKSLFVAFFCLALAKASILADGPVSYESHQVLRVEVPDRDSFDFLTTLPVSFWNEGRVGGHADVMVAPDLQQHVVEELMHKQMQYSVMVANVQDLIRLEQVSAKTGSRIEDVKHDMSWDKYHPKEDMEGYMDYLAATYDYVSVESIGKSYEGVDMRVLKVCQGGCGQKPAMWIDGGIHAREWISPATVTFMMRELVENNDQHTELTQNLDWYMLPVLNPDGYKYTQTNDRMWRKTRSDSGSIWCKGTDANRNYGHMFDTGGASDDKCSETYHGPEAFSEVENRNVRDFLLQHSDQVKFFNSIHSYSQLILLPWGYTGETSPPNFDKMLSFANKANEALYNVHHKEYRVGCIPCMLYIASGGSMDWTLGELGIPYSFGMELRDTGLYGFLLPASQIIPTGEETWAFHRSAAEQIIQEFHVK